MDKDTTPKPATINVRYSKEESRYEVTANGVYLGPADYLLKFVYAAVVDSERDRLFPTPGFAF